ncbi:MAG: molybdopterin-dependent oxidoreductase [Chloroflexi bacterium]|nr:molybdopterin-dependent oxidoreductase [Chloroflexota bacterium]MDA1145005.1 molybdopterin-dependent oxidoreductase [Chloroflexota bacterium]
MISLNGESLEVAEGLPLIEVIKEQGVTITNLCYIDGLEPYAGCRTCLVEIEGGRPTNMQLACTAKTADGMVVQTETEAVKRSRQGVMSLILANHPDRCLTCHRRVHCMPGDICLRDDVVTHRCLTCSKNYRCELQTSCEIVDMGDFAEPWVGESRSYYETPPPEPDRGNPYLEFDPQMCIICTRCVRACDDLRHTGALTLSGKGHTTMIAFGTGGQIHESDCDFCGACIDVCPTATLMEKPNKWRGLAEDWTNSACNGCAVGCTLTYGMTDDQPVIVRPDRINPVSRDQICARGRFGYTEVGDRERLSRSLVRTGDRLLSASPEHALARAAESLTAVKNSAGAGAIAVLGSPLATTEEAYLLARLARETIGTEHLDFSHGPLHRGVAAAFNAAFGTNRLPSDLTAVEQAHTIVVLGGDIEESHQVVSLRVKDAVTKRGAKLVLISNRWNELVPFAEAWLRPTPGSEAAAAQALADGLAASPADVPGVAPETIAAAIATLRAAKDGDANDTAVIFAPAGGHGAARATAEATAAANLAIASHGAAAAQHLHYLPTDANVLGIADAGVAPGERGHDFTAIIEGAKNGSIKAIVLHDDNPLLNAPGTADIETALANLEALVVIDSLRSTAGEHATVILAELPFHAKDGTLTSADRRIIRQRPAAVAQRDERGGVAILVALAAALGGPLSYDGPADVMRDMASRVAGYVPYSELDRTPGQVRALPTSQSLSANAQPLPAAGAPSGDGLAIITGRSLFTSWAGASIRSDEADKLHREESALVNPRDAEALGARDGDQAVLSNGTAEVRIRIKLDDGVAPGTVYVPHYYDGGAVMRLLPLSGDGSAVAVTLRTLQPA